MILLDAPPPIGAGEGRLPHMTMFLDLTAAWIALDVVLIATWHLAHVRSRRLGTRVLAGGSPTQRVYTLAPEVRLGEPQPVRVRATHA
jgi:hypothetical protein